MKVTAGTKPPWKDRKWTRKNYPTALALTKQELFILKKLAHNAPANPNRLSKITKKAYSFVYETLKNLEKREIISSRVAKSEKGTKETIYDLELDGIFWIIEEEVFARKNNKESRDLLIQIMKHYREKLPLVFGKWSYFRDAGLEDLFFFRLWFLVGWQISPGYKGKDIKKQMTHYFYLFDFYGLVSPLFQFDVNKWFNAWKNDCEIGEFIVEELKHDLEVLRINQTNVQDAISFLNKNC